MKIGLMLGGLPRADVLGDLAREVEDLGFDSLWAGDHVAFPAPILDPLQILACYATRTKCVQLGTCVYLLPLRHATVVAKMVASLDFLAAGRLIFGVGVGGEFPAEFEACGVPVEERGPRANEGIDVLRRLWSGDAAEHEGRFYRFPSVELKPPPTQAGGPPIWIGGRSEAALRRAARLGDGYVGYLLGPQGCRERFDRIRVLAGEAGRGEHPITRALMTFAVVDRDRSAAMAQASAMLGAMYGRSMESAAARYCVTGSPAECRAAVEGYAAAGVEHLILTPLSYGDALREQIQSLAEALRPAAPLESRA